MGFYAFIFERKFSKSFKKYQNEKKLGKKSNRLKSSNSFKDFYFCSFTDSQTIEFIYSTNFIFAFTSFLYMLNVWVFWEREFEQCFKSNTHKVIWSVVVEHYFQVEIVSKNLIIFSSLNLFFANDTKL